MGLSQDQFVSSIAEILEVHGDVLHPDTVLADLEGYDSVKTLSLFVVLDEMGISVSQIEAARLCTFGDVLGLARSRNALTDSE